jgi:hypothetical protein
MKHYKSIISIAIIFLLFVLAQLCLADLYFESEQISRGVPGRPDGKAVLKQYFTADMAMLDLGDRLTIMNFKEKVYHELLKSTKTYTTGPLDRMRLESIGIETQGLEHNTVVNSILQAVAQSATVTPTREVQKIGGYTCRKYGVRFLMTDAVYWTSKEIDGYEELKALADSSIEAFSGNPMLQRMNILGLVRELDGYPVMTVTYLLGGSITNMLIQSERKTLDPELFKVPAGYSLIR